MKRTTLLFLTMLMSIVSMEAQNFVHNELERQDLSESKSTQKMLKRKVAIARFTNETRYAKGLFFDKENDPMEKQAMDILSSKLAASEKFILLERSDLDQIIAEQAINKLDTSLVGADYIIVGAITEYGRKNTGNSKLFSRSVKQIVEAGVSIRLIDVATGEIVYSEEAKGESEIKSKTVLGFGGEAGYDATLDDKAIEVAISKLVENVITNCMDRPWKAYLIGEFEEGYIMSGGNSQGVAVGDIFEVFMKGKNVINPQNGMALQLPGKSVAKIEVISLGGDTANNEFSVVKVIEGSIVNGEMLNYVVKEDVL